MPAVVGDVTMATCCSGACDVSVGTVDDVIRAGGSVKGDSSDICDANAPNAADDVTALPADVTLTGSRAGALFCDVDTMASERLALAGTAGVVCFCFMLSVWREMG